MREYRSSYSGIPVYAAKDRIREHLEALNRDQKVCLPTRHLGHSSLRLKLGHKSLTPKRLQVLKYTLFQPGLFLNYFTHPYPSAKHLVMSVHCIDFENRQAILIDDGNQPVTFTSVQDLAAVVAEALDYPHEWPTVGGVRGWRTTSADLVKLGETLRGVYLRITTHMVSCESLGKRKHG